MTQSIYKAIRNSKSPDDSNVSSDEQEKSPGADSENARQSIDVQGLLELAKDTDNLARQRLLDTVTKIRFDGDVRLTVIEEKLVDEILCQLLVNAELETRKRIALKVCRDSNPSRRLLSYLIQEEFEIAQPVLESCESLNDFDLISVIRRQSAGHRLAIARRQILSHVVTDKLIDCEDNEALVALLESQKPNLSESGRERLVERSKDVPSLRKPLVFHPQTTVATAYQMFWWVDGDLRASILKDRPVDRSMLEEILNEVAPGGLEVTERHEVLQSVLRIAEPSHAANVPEIIEMIRSNRLKDFIESVIDHLGISTDLVRHTLLDRGGEALAVLCRAIGADRQQFNTICIMLDHKRFGKARAGALIQHDMDVFKSIDVKQAAATLAVWELDDLLIA